jgi:hypothetical protein
VGMRVAHTQETQKQLLERTGIYSEASTSLPPPVFCFVLVEVLGFELTLAGPSLLLGRHSASP